MTKPIAAYVGVSAAYWAFMLSDGALRMLVLFHFHGIGYTALQLAYLFLLYEIAGVITNLSAGWIAARFGLASTLFSGLLIQIVALMMLVPFADDAGVGLGLVYVMCAQGLSGVAKDLTKMSAKSAVKSLVPEGGGALFKWVALLTGAKNAIKGVGFFVGAALLALFGFAQSLAVMAAFLAVIFVVLLVKLPSGLPQGKKSAKFSEVFSKSSNVNWLSLARVFLFGARDVWFVVALPIYLYSQLQAVFMWQGGAFFAVGAFMAIWIIFYGAVQARAPHWLGAKDKPVQAIIAYASMWVFALAAIPALLCVSLWVYPALSFVVIGGVLYVFGAVFAINSSLHSFLILQFSDQSRVSMDVGFYYMANAMGRFMGTLASGLSYQYGGLTTALVVATIFLVISGAAATKLKA